MLVTDIPVLYPVHGTALWNEASHHQSFLQRVPHNHPTAGRDLNTAQRHSLNWHGRAEQADIRKEMCWCNHLSLDAETLKFKVGVRMFLAAIDLAGHGFRCAATLVCVRHARDNVLFCLVFLNAGNDNTYKIRLISHKWKLTNELIDWWMDRWRDGWMDGGIDCKLQPFTDPLTCREPKHRKTLL